MGLRKPKIESGGVELPALSNPASGEHILSGYEAIDGEGNKITGKAVVPSYTVEEVTYFVKTQNTTINLPLTNPKKSTCRVYGGGGSSCGTFYVGSSGYQITGSDGEAYLNYKTPFTRTATGLTLEKVYCGSGKLTSSSYSKVLNHGLYLCVIDE